MLGLETQLHKLVHYITSESEVYPTLALGAQVASDAAADWTYGAYATIVAAGVIVPRYHVIAVSIEDCDKNGVFQLQLYRGAADGLIATVRFAAVGGFWGNAFYVVGSEICEAGDRLRARLAFSDVTGVGQATIRASVCYYRED